MITPTTELFINGAWVDVTGDTYQGEGLTITRGRADEASTADPATCSLVLDNRSGDYSARNPVGAYYGAIGRNTPLRVTRPLGLDNHVYLSGGLRLETGTWSGFVSTADHSSLDIVGDIDIRVDVEPCSWRPGGDGYGLAQKATALSTLERSWRFWLDGDGYLNFTWSPDATIAADLTKTSTVAVPATSGRLVVRVILDVNNGAAGNTVRFYTAPSLGGTYTQLGADVVTAGTTVIDANNGTLDVGRVNLTWSNLYDPDVLLQGAVYGAQVRSGIAGSLVAQPDFTLMDSGDTSLTDASSRVWSLQGNAVAMNPNARFHGEVSKWPVRWDKSGRDVRSPLTASGPMQRLSQGATTKPVKSVMHRWFTSEDSDSVRAYWPCEDADDAEEFASALPDAPPMRHPSGETNNASYDLFKASEPLPTASLVQWTGEVPTYTATGHTRVRFLAAVPAGGPPGTAILCRLRAADLAGGGLNAARWDLSLGVGGSLKIEVFNNEDISVHDSGFVAADLNGKRVMVDLHINDSTSDIDWEVYVHELGDPDAFTFTGSMSSRSFGRVERVAMNVGGVMDDIAMGHVCVQSSFTDWTPEDDARLVAYKGEVAATRILRLCQEEDVAVVVRGDSRDGALLGPQLPGALLDLVREAADSDMGVLYEAREALALAYRTSGSLYAQEAALTLDYESRHVSEIEPTEDDDAPRNDITVTMASFGGSARVEDTTSRMSVNPPPAGIGRYEEEVQISLSRADDLPNQAAWRLHLGTVDEPRFPVIGVNLARSVFTSDSAFTGEATALDVGDRIVIENPPDGVGAPEDIQQITQGFTETFTGPEWLLDMNCTPASPWDVGVWDDSAGVGEARYSTDGTLLTADVPSSGAALVLNGVSPGRASTPDAAALDIVGDIDVRAHVAMDDWTPATMSALVSKYTASGNQRSWYFAVQPSGVLRFVWTTAGITNAIADSTVAPTVSNGAALWVRVTFDVDNGAAGRTATFYTSTDGNTWTQLGTPVTTAGVTSIFNSTAPVVIGGTDNGTSNGLSGKVSAIEIRNGIAGTRVARPEFGAQPAGTTSFADAQGNTWTVTSPGVIADVANTLFPGTLFVSTPTGPVWAATDAPYDLMLGGERVTLTALTGTGVAQVFRVTRAVNGVRKGHATGAPVELAKPAVLAL